MTSSLVGSEMCIRDRLTTDWSALVRLIRYLVVRPRCVYFFPWQYEGATCLLYTSDAADDM
eukprot:10107768-Prorocentrum_lima.AAC.1